MPSLQAPVALFPYDNKCNRPTSYYCWSHTVDYVNRNGVWYPLAHDLALVPAVHSDSILGQLSRHNPEVYAWLWIAEDWVEIGRAFTGIVHLPYVEPDLAPVKLWRAVNAGGNGFRARGNMVEQGWGIPINTANFQLRLENHFNWRHPDKSPVLSCTAKRGYAENLCRKWLERKSWQTGEIALLEIDCQALVRDQSVKLWKQEDIVNTFGLHDVQANQHEYIVLAEIPEKYCKMLAWN